MPAKIGEIIIPKDGFYLLNDDNVGIEDKVKGARLMWVSPSFTLPNKVQSILEWIMKQTSQKYVQTNKSTNTIVWSTLCDFVTSKQFDEHLNKASKNIVVRPAFIKTLNEYLNKVRDLTEFQTILGICELCMFRHGVTLAMRNNLHGVMTYYAQMLLAMERCPWHGCSEFDLLVDHLIKLTNYICLRCGQDKNIKQVFATSLETIFTVIMQLLTKCQSCEDNKLIKKISYWSDALKKLLKVTFFSSENEDILITFAKLDDSKQLKNFPALHTTTLAVELRNKIKQLLNDSTKGMSLVEMTRQFLVNYPKIAGEIKFLWLQKLMNDLVALNIKSISSSNALPGLLQLMQDFEIYKSSYGKVDVVSWMGKIFQCLLSDGELSEQVCNSVVIMLKIDHTIVETKLQALLSSLIVSSLSHTSKTLVGIAEFYVSIRQVEKLMKILLLSLKNNSNEDIDQKKLSVVVDHVAISCVKSQSATVLLEIFSIIQTWITKEVQLTIENLPSVWPVFVQKCLSYYMVVWCAVAHNLRVLDLWNYTLNRSKLCTLLNDTKKDVFGKLIKKSETIEMHNDLLFSMMETCSLYCEILKTLSIYAISSCKPVELSPFTLLYNCNVDSVDYLKFVNLEENICKPKTWKKFIKLFAESSDSSLKMTYAKWCFFKISRCQQLNNLLQILPQSQLHTDANATVPELLEQFSVIEQNLFKGVEQLLPSTSNTKKHDLFVTDMALMITQNAVLFVKHESNKLIDWLLDVVLSMDFKTERSFVNETIASCALYITTDIISHLERYVSNLYKDLSDDKKIVEKLSKQIFLASSVDQLNLKQNKIKNILQINEKTLHIMDQLNIGLLSNNNANDCFKLLIMMIKMTSCIFPTDMMNITLEPFVDCIYKSIVSEPDCLSSYHHDIENLFYVCYTIDSEKFIKLSVLLLKYILNNKEEALAEDKFQKLLNVIKKNPQVATMVIETMVDFVTNNVDFTKIQMETSSESFLVQSLSKSRKRKIQQLEIPAKIRRKNDSAFKDVKNRLVAICETLQNELKPSHSVESLNNILKCYIGLHIAKEPFCGTERDMAVVKQKLSDIFDSLKDTEHILTRSEMDFISLSCKLYLFKPSLGKQSKKSWKSNINLLINMNKGLDHDWRNMIENYLFLSPSKTTMKHFLADVSEKMLRKFQKDKSLSLLKVIEIVATVDWDIIVQIIDTDAKAAEEFMCKFLRTSLGNLSDIIQELAKGIDESSSIIQNLACSLQCYLKILETKRIVFHNFELSNVFSTVHCVPLVKLAEEINNSSSDIDMKDFEEIFSIVCEIFSHLMAHKRYAENWIPLITMTISTLFKTIVVLGKYRIEENSTNVLEPSMRCGKLLERKTQAFVHNFSANIGKCATSLMSEFVVSIADGTINSSVKRILLDICYAFMQFLDEYSVAMLKACLPIAVRNSFCKIYEDYCRYHKFHGFV